MNKKAKMFMACMIVICTLAGMSFVLKPSNIEAGEFQVEKYDSHGTMSIEGYATIECEPDQLVIYLKIKGLDKNSAEKARDQASIIIDRVVKSLKKLGIPEKNIETISYNIGPKYEWEYNETGARKKVFKGYEVTARMKITVLDFDKAGSVIDSSVDAGAFVDSIHFELSSEKRNELKIEALNNAAKDAEIKAEAILSALGEELGHVTNVTLNRYSYSPRVFWDSVDYTGVIKESEIVPPTTIMPSDLTVSANVYVDFDII